MRLVWTATFVRAFKRHVKRDPALRGKIESALRQLAEDPFQAGLRTHKLRGDLADTWSCSIDFENRILFDLVENPETGEREILLLTLGSHDEVY